MGLPPLTLLRLADSLGRWEGGGIGSGRLDMFQWLWRGRGWLEYASVWLERIELRAPYISDCCSTPTLHNRQRIPACSCIPDYRPVSSVAIENPWSARLQSDHAHIYAALWALCLLHFRRRSSCSWSARNRVTPGRSRTV